MNLAARNPLQILELLREHFGERVFRSFVRHNVNLAEAPAHNTYIAAYMRGSNGALDYTRVADEFEERVAARSSNFGRKEVANA